MSALKKDRIKDKMVHTVARLWEVEESEIEHNFDPLILLLIEACAAELEKIGNDINDSHTRLMDYLAEMLLPESLFGAMPASGIVQGMPAEAVAEIDPGSSFSLVQKVNRPITGTTESVDIHLSPIGHFKLINAELCYLYSGNKLFRIKENNSKELINSPERMNDSNTLWLALSFDKAVDSLQGLSVYFDLRSHSLAASFYNSLAYAKCLLNEKPVDVSSGFGAPADLAIDHKAILHTGDSRTNKINRKTGHIYQSRFITLGKSGKLSASQLPAAWKENLPTELQKQLEAERLCFLQIELPQYFPQEVFDIISCNINAFPVVNKKLNSFSYTTDEWLNIVPIPAGGAFFDLAQVKNEKGDPYKIRSSAGADNVAAGEVIVRRSGVGNTSSGEVREMIHSITESIRDQSAYFGQMSNEFILGRLREIGKMLAGLEDNISAATDKKPDHHYLMLRPKKKGEIVIADYWVTNGTDANQVKAGEQINSVNNTLVNPKKSYTLTSFAGGKNSISKMEKKTLLRQQLVSGGKIISAEDVKLLCIQLYGEKLRKVEVGKGVQVSNKKEEGFRRTIDVSLWYSDKVNETMKAEMDNLCHELGFMLETNASPVYPFRIKVMNTA